MLRRFVLATSLLVALSGCGASEEPAETTVDVDEGELTSGQSVSTGVRYLDMGTAGDAILVAYAGYSVTQAQANAWASQLHATTLAGQGVRHVYAVRGPQSASYAEREIGNTGLARHLLKLAPKASRIVVIAHSSGSYVAHELLSHLYVAGLDHGETTGKIDYFNLDGGGSGLSAGIVNELASVRFVYVDGSRGTSANAATMKALASTWAGQGSALAVDGSSSGCNVGAKWCLHDVLINRRPYSASTFDLARDYGQINPSHPVQTAYLEAAR